VDKFGNIKDPVFSPRISAMFKPTPAHSFRVSYNRAFRAPSVVNNYLDTPIIGRVIDLRPLAPFLPPPLNAFVATPFPLIVNNVGNANLKEESVTAYEIAYTGTFNGKTTVGLALYQNDQDDNINFVSLVDNPTLPGFTLYTPADPPPGVPGALIAVLGGLPAPFGPIFFPKNGGTYLNLGPTRQRGLEASIDHAFNNRWTAFANYSFQDAPEVLEPDSGQIRYPTSEVGIPARHRFNAGVNFNDRRYLGSLSVNYSDKAFWVDVLDRTFAGFSDSYTMLNASFGVKWNEGRVVTSIKGTNLTNESIQQHNFGDILRRSIVGEVQFKF
jgi:outer membrane receptor protein involved in Fe transport